MKWHTLVLALAPVTVLGAEEAVLTLPPFADGPSSLPAVTVYSPRVANQAPTTTFAMPVSELRYEPLVDIQARNAAEGQADLTIRGGIFENTGVQVGTVSLLDPQTGHYLDEIPIAPAMLRAPDVLTGADLATAVTNATVGAVRYGWRPIRTAGALQVGIGPHALAHGEIYQGYRTAVNHGSAAAADVDVAHSESNGPIALGDHRFDRANARLQFTSRVAQTDVFAGYQAKFFGWPNLYTPFNSAETENLETLLLAVNHRIDFGAGEFFEAGAYHRRNKDDYAFNRFAPLVAVHPFQHTTWQDGVAMSVRRAGGGLAWNARAEILADFLTSTSLTAGRYHSRTLSKIGLMPEKTWQVGPDTDVTAKAGATYEDSNRDGGHASPVAELALGRPGATIRRGYLQYSQSTQMPTYTALNSSAASGLFRGNPDLGRETSRNFELGASGLFAGWGFNTAVFARQDRSLVDWTFRRGVTARTANAVDVDTVGFEAVVRHSWKAFDLVLGYTALAKDPDYRGAVVDASFYALNYARQRLTAAITARLGEGFEVRMDNVARVQASNLLRTVGGDRAVLSTLSLAYRPPFAHQVELSIQIDNVWNTRFQEVPAVPASPRQWSISGTQLW